MTGGKGRKRKSGEEREDGLSDEVGSGSARVVSGGECLPSGALGGDNYGSVVENSGVKMSGGKFRIGDGIEVSGSAVSASKMESKDLEGAGDPSGNGGGVASTCMEIDQDLKENGGVGGLDCKEPEIKRCDVGDGVEGGFHTPGKAERSSKKPKGGSGKGKLNPDAPLRRSARRAALVTPEKPVITHLQPSPVVAETSFDMRVEDNDGECKPELPSSSRSPNLDGLPILDVFSVYSCLRSFSTSLFLSPFSLEMFVEAINSRFACSLIDHVHFSVLSALKIRLHSLAEERNMHASDCLRALNWELLDLVNWPFYLVEYLLLFHFSSKEPCFELSSIKLLDSEYYKQPGRIKIQILRLLCDDVVDGEFIRLELQGQMIASDLSVDFDQEMASQSQNGKPNNIGLPIAPESSDMILEDGDRNIDECCLCKMDGILICCDGCPAAFHSRCLGVAKDTLPEGDWYCPECLVRKPKSIKFLKPFRGAEILGIDLHGRIYFGSCGYLLVSDFHDPHCCLYYRKCDIGAVIDILLKSSPSLYNDITDALSLYLGEDQDIPCRDASLLLPLNCSGYMTSKKIAVCLDFVKDFDRNDMVAVESSSHKDNPTTCSRGSMGIYSTPLGLTQKTGAEVSTCSGNQEDLPLDAADASMKEEIKIEPKNAASFSWPNQMRSFSIVYTNHYSFGRVVSSMADLILPKSSGAMIDVQVTIDDLVANQLNAILKTIEKFGWPLVQRLSSTAFKERCGWCLSCRSIVGEECMLNSTEKKLAGEQKTASLGLRSTKNRKSHFIFAVHHLLVMEDNLHGLLCGPWQNPAYRKLWRKNILKITDVRALKQQLLMLEANIRQVALTSDWLKLLPIDSDSIFGSASHIFTVPVNDLSKHFGGRKRGRKGKLEHKKHNLDAELTYKIGETNSFWRRGGRLSRQVFHWRVLPKSLVAKGARRAGCQKISGLVYYEGTEFPKRSKCVAWRAAVEMSKTVAEIIFYVKDLDSHIKWNDIKNMSVFPNLERETAKQSKPLKNVLIRRKCLVADKVNYLFDFGKRKKIPDVVTKYAVMPEETSSGRKKCWLNEYDIPLGLIKSFEVKKLEQRMKKSKMDEKMHPHENLIKLRKPKGFPYLFLKLQDPEYKKCSQCSADVLVREAVRCQSCEGIFHREHFAAAECVTNAMYSCFDCKKKEINEFGRINGEDSSKISKMDTVKLKRSKGKGVPKGSVVGTAKVGQRKRKHQTGKYKVGFTVSEQPLKKKKNEMILGGQKKVKLAKKGKNALLSEICGSIENGLSWFRRKRTTIKYSFWSNGLWWSAKPNDERGRSFQSTKVLMPVAHAGQQCPNPVCILCHEKYDPKMIYLCCENCGDWFHGIAVSVTMENIDNLIGFRCHKCRLKSIPVSPCFRSELIPAVNLLENIDLQFVAHGSVGSDEVQCSGGHTDKEVAVAGCLVEIDVIPKELIVHIALGGNQGAAHDDSIGGSKIDNVQTESAIGTSDGVALCVNETMNMPSHLQQNVKLGGSVVHTNASIFGKQTHSSFVDPGNGLVPADREQKSRELGKLVSLEDLDNHDMENEMLVAAQSAPEEKHLEPEVTQVGLLSQASLSHSNSSPDGFHVLNHNGITGIRDGTTNVMRFHGCQKDADYSPSVEVGCAWNLVDRNQAEDGSSGHFNGSMHEGSPQSPRRLMETNGLLAAEKVSPENDNEC